MDILEQIAFPDIMGEVSDLPRITGKTDPEPSVIVNERNIRAFCKYAVNAYGADPGVVPRLHSFYVQGMDNGRIYRCPFGRKPRVMIKKGNEIHIYKI